MKPGTLNVINVTIRNLLGEIEKLEKKQGKLDDVLKILDELEDQLDDLLTQLAPERITDERFSAAVNAVNEVSAELKDLRKALLEGRYKYAKDKVLDVQTAIRNAYRLMLLVHAGAPTAFIFQVTPQFLREELLSAPETLVLANPMAAQIYNILLRKGQASIEELALELNIDDKTRDEFNNAIAHLIMRGYVRVYYTKDNKTILRPARG